MIAVCISTLGLFAREVFWKGRTSMIKQWFSLRRIVPLLGLVLVFLGPIFFYSTLQFLRKVDYAAATLAFLAGWCLLRAGVDLTRAALAITEISPAPRVIKKTKSN